MAVTSDYYYNIYHGIEFDDIDTYLARAEDMIQNIISSAPVGEYQQTHYNKAVCAQAEAIGIGGGLAVWLTAGSSSSFTIGSFSMSGGAQTSGGGSVQVSDVAMGYLESAGLLSRGIGLIAPAKEVAL